ncbi:unnamed protein product [Ilex paraguariensis]|uniref:J domain-containing protein n=1 Tax=Ilex paraguariensis TaxID=185542 RepID=A0ABC8T351_9AQUA
MEQNTSRAEAERLLGIAEKLLLNKDFNGSKEFAILSQETEPLLDGPDQILAVAEVLVAADKRINNQPDWYGVLQIERRSDDLEIIKKQYRRLAFLLHPDKNRYAFADTAFKLVADAWAVLSDSKKKFVYDSEMNRYSKVDLVAVTKQRETQQRKQQNQPDPHQKLPVRRGSQGSSGGREEGDDRGTRMSSFWTTCPYCYNLYEYPKVYDGCCLRCQNCKRAFSAVEIPSMPPLVPGKEAYSCCWGFFPMGFTVSTSDAGKSEGFPNWMPPMFSAAAPAAPVPTPAPAPARVAVNGRNATPAKPVGPKPGGKKRGRPRKNLI